MFICYLPPAAYGKHLLILFPTKFTVYLFIYLFIYLSIYLFIYLKDNCYTVLCWFLLNSNINHPKVYPCTLLLEQPLPPPPSLLPSTSLSSLSSTSNSHWLSILHMVKYVSMLLSIHPTFSFLPSPSHVHKPVLNICVFFASLKIRPSVPYP